MWEPKKILFTFKFTNYVVPVFTVMTLDFVFLKNNISVEFPRSVQFMRHFSMKYEDVSDFLTCPVT